MSDSLPETPDSPERDAILRKVADGIPTFAFQCPLGTPGVFSLTVLRETLRDLVHQYALNDTEGLDESMTLVAMNVSLLSGEG